MKKVYVYSDCHWFGPTPSKELPIFGPDVKYIGDNHELKNVPKSKVVSYVNEYRDFLNQCYATDTGVVAGNHERSAGTDFCKNPYWHIDDGVLYFHGDILSYSEKKMKAWRTGKMGKSRWTIAGIGFKNFFRNMGGGKSISEKKKEKVLKYLEQFGCHTAVFGHTHPAKVIDVTYKGKRIINVPRGYTQLEV